MALLAKPLREVSQSAAQPVLRGLALDAYQPIAAPAPVVGPNIEKLPYGATCSFRCPDRCFQRCCGPNFAEKDARDLRREASVTRILMEVHLSNFSYNRLLRQRSSTGTP